jgi:hypothetical protein
MKKLGATSTASEALRRAFLSNLEFHQFEIRLPPLAERYISPHSPPHRACYFSSSASPSAAQDLR